MVFNVLIIDFFHESVIRELNSIPNINVEYAPNLSEKQIFPKLKNISVLILRTSYTITPLWFEKATKLKMIIVGANGTNHIDKGEIKKREIVLKNVQNASVNAVVEYSICLMLMELRKINEGIESVKKGEWIKNELLGKELSKKKVGLVGYGQIGQAMAKKMKLFGVSIYYSDPFNIDEEYIKASLEEICIQCDIICIQVPLNSKTKGMIDLKILPELKEGAVMINLSRYEVINMNDLYEFLLNSSVDNSFYVDPLEKVHLKEITRFNGLPVTFLPHLGANTLETQSKIGKKMILSLKEFISSYITTV